MPPSPGEVSPGEIPRAIRELIESGEGMAQPFRLSWEVLAGQWESLTVDPQAEGDDLALMERHICELVSLLGVLARAKAINDSECVEIQVQKSAEALSQEVIVVEVCQNYQAVVAELEAHLRSVEASQDEFISTTQAVFGVLDIIETRPSSPSVEVMPQGLRKVPLCIHEEGRDPTKAAACQAFAIMKSLYPRVDFAVADKGFALDCDLELMNEAQEAVDGVCKTIDLQ
uniref:Uncharacterized protein n=1 Tax=Oryza brachyantha TaxID=4533 RepID=J3N1I5_ORYBR